MKNAERLFKTIRTFRKRERARVLEELRRDFADDQEILDCLVEEAEANYWTTGNYLRRLSERDYPIGEYFERDEEEYDANEHYRMIVNRVQHHFHRMRLIPTQLRNRDFEFYSAMSRFSKLSYEKRLAFRRKYNEVFASRLGLETSPQ